MPERPIGFNQTESIPLSVLDLAETKPVAGGAEKSVFKVEHNGQLLAVKIFRKFDGGFGLRLNRQRGALNEFRAHKLLKTTPVGIFVPEALAIITGRSNSPIGLTTTWIDGQVIRDVHYPLLSNMDVDLLESTLLATVKMGIYPNMDMFSEANLIFSPYREQKVWFAECGLSSREAIRRYQGMVENYMQNLRQNYSKPHHGEPV